MFTRLPRVYGVAEARKAMTEMLDEVGRGEAFIIKGTKNREALVLDAEAFRKFQRSYMDLVGLVETSKILEDEEALAALGEVDEGVGERFSLSEVERMVDDADNGE